MSSYYLSKDFSGSFSASFPSFYLLNSDVSQDTVLGLLPFVLDSPTILWAPAASEPSMGPQTIYPATMYLLSTGTVLSCCLHISI